jgi:hypothetical protein
MRRSIDLAPREGSTVPPSSPAPAASYSPVWVLYWEKRADESRAMAEKIKDAEAERVLCRIAEAYDELAERARQAATRCRASGTAPVARACHGGDG